MAFSRFKNVLQSSPFKKVVEKRSKVENILDGSVVKSNISFEDVEVSNPDVYESIPSPDEYTLEVLLKSGVGLEEVPTTILTPSSVESVNSMAEELVYQIDNTNNED